MSKKSVIILVCIISALLFAALVYQGLRHSRGVPVEIEKVEKVVLETPFINMGLDLASGIFLNRWDTLGSKEIELKYQVTILPWGKSLVSPIEVKAFHNRKDIYFYITWKDDTENREIGSNKFSDACAIMFPMDDKAQPSTLMMGFLGSANIWHWKASQDREFWLKIQQETEAYADFYYPFEEELFIVSKDEVASAVRDLMAIRVGTITPKERQDVDGRGFWKDGAWHVVFKRSLRAIDPEVDAVFNLGTTERLCAFAVWNGEQGDRGARKSISDWVGLEIR